MLIEDHSKYLLKKTRAKSKMFEYDVPLDEHIDVESNAIDLLLITIGVIGNSSNNIWKSETVPIIVSEEDQKELEFSSRFFDALFQSKLELRHQKYYLLLGSIAYYFSDMIGSSMVLSQKLEFGDNFGSSGIAVLIEYFLKGKQDKPDIELLNGKYQDELMRLLTDYELYFEQKRDVDFTFFEKLKNKVYSEGTSRELLLVDALLAIFKKKILHSPQNLMPGFSNISSEVWHEQLGVQEKITELWPAQIKFGIEGVFDGNSGVIQMPTSSGKTTSIALTIQSAFLSGRTNLAVVVAPFRALCKEISDDLGSYFKANSNFVLSQLSDIPNTEELFGTIQLHEEKMQVIVLTPEKFLYLLRNDHTILERMGLVIFDEAHLFDDGSRGADYELLLSTIKLYLDGKKDIQKLLISAVIPNPEELNNWFNNGSGQIIADNTIKSSEKTVAFSDWGESGKSKNGILHFINPENMNEEEFFVPRVVETSNLEKKGKERKQRRFPEYGKTSDIGIYFSIKLIHNGGVAIFCPTKVVADNILKRFIEIEERGYDISTLSRFCKHNEHEKVGRLIEHNYGTENEIYKAALRGIFVHHAGISNGIRNCVEYAIKNNLSRCVVCTSTLAQGVNLPIKYLIVPSFYQAGKEFKVRDFHNLIGRTGRAGKYTEGSIIFSDSTVYPQRFQDRNRWKFEKYTHLLETGNSEKCSSNILKIVQQVSFKEGAITYTVPFKVLVEFRYSDKASYRETIEEWRKVLQSYKVGLETFEERLSILENTLEAIENYILESFAASSESEQDIKVILGQTFGYFLANDEEKRELIHLFELVQEYILNNISENDISIFSKAQLGVFQSEELNNWVLSKVELFNSSENEQDLIRLIFPQLIRYSENNSIKKVIQEEEIANILMKWIAGESYFSILEYCKQNRVTVKDNRPKAKQRDILLSDIIEICDNGFGYSAIMVVNAIAEIVAAVVPNSDVIRKKLNLLSQKMRYGLPDKKAILVYEIGFSDRVVAQRIGEVLFVLNLNKANIKSTIKENKVTITEILSAYPSYFEHVLSEL